jgi:hypothetical protein
MRYVPPREKQPQIDVTRPQVLDGFAREERPAANHQSKGQNPWQ